MSMAVKFKINVRRFYSKQGLFFVSLLLVLVLFSSCVVLVFTGVFPFVSRGSDKVVGSEVELRNAVDNAAGFTTIALSKDIVLTGVSLVIPAGRDINLTSNRVSGFYKLIGCGLSTIIVEDGGVLRLDGITVTQSGDGRGVTVNEGGKLFLYSGEISGNHGVSGGGGGVYASGSFVMSGGKISGNTASDRGGGVCLFHGSFIMSGGTITGNIAYYTFASNMTVYGAGGGVYVDSESSFVMSGGSISGNTARYGGGVYVWQSSFSMSGGAILGNTAEWGGGMYVSSPSVVSRTGGAISDNTGGDMYPYNTNNNELSNKDSSNFWNHFSPSWDMIIWISIIVVVIGVVGVVLFLASKTKLEPVGQT